jgi:chlorobactene glucosyltransferase
LPAHLLENVIFLSYAAVGPVGWIWGVGALIIERRRMTRPEVLGQPLPDPPPRVTVFIPARNEEQVIRESITAVLAQTYPNFKVVAVDHQSTDGTGAILDALAAADPRLTVLHLTTDRPAGWTGKSFALAQASRLAEGSWLLFIDADCILAPRALAATVAGAEHKGVELVSLLPKMAPTNAWERTVPPVAALLGSLLDRGLHEPYAYGWFMLFRRSAYDRIGGHDAIGAVIDDDKAFASSVKAAGGRSRVWWGTEYATLRLQRRPGEIVRGLTRNFFTLSKGRTTRLLFLLFFLVFCCASAYPVAALGIVRWLRPPPSRLGWGYLAADERAPSCCFRSRWPSASG